MKMSAMVLGHSSVPVRPPQGARRSCMGSPATPVARVPRVRSSAQAALLAALGSSSSILTLVLMASDQHPAALLVVAPLWSLWLRSFIDWIQGAWIPEGSAPALANTSRPEATTQRAARLSRCWQRKLEGEKAVASDASGNPVW
ncbi:MAG: hypothetical protein ACE5GX_19310 [Thermoanaerobaculia bacterium]